MLSACRNAWEKELMSRRTTTWRRLGEVLSAVGIAAITVSGCTATPPGPVPPPVENFSECGNEVPPGGEQVSFPNAEGGLLKGMLYGTGKVGLVLAHQSDGNYCQWDPFVKHFVDQGYRALEFDFSGFGRSPQRQDATVGGDVVAAANFLRARGASEIVLIGASLGGAAVSRTTARGDRGRAGRARGRARPRDARRPRSGSTRHGTSWAASSAGRARSRARRTTGRRSPTSSPSCGGSASTFTSATRSARTTPT